LPERGRELRCANTDGKRDNRQGTAVPEDDLAACSRCSDCVFASANRHEFPPHLMLTGFHGPRNSITALPTNASSVTRDGDQRCPAVIAALILYVRHDTRYGRIRAHEHGAPRRDRGPNVLQGMRLTSARFGGQASWVKRRDVWMIEVLAAEGTLYSVDKSA
jgi:hypothetical protein